MTPRYASEKRPIYRSRNDRVLAGVCGGIAEHFDFAPWGVRAIAILLTPFFNVIVPIAYVVLACTMKEEPFREYRNEDEREFWDAYRHSRGEALRRVERMFDKLDKRLQRMESVVTSPGFEVEDEFKRL
jgi:phage shock protein C